MLPPSWPERLGTGLHWHGDLLGRDVSALRWAPHLSLRLVTRLGRRVSRAGSHRRTRRDRLFYWILKRVVLGPILRLIFRPWVEGLENIPEEGGAILASNHLSFSDSIFLPAGGAPAGDLPRQVRLLQRSRASRDGSPRGSSRAPGSCLSTGPAARRPRLP